MSVSTTLNKVIYTGNGTTTVFGYTFYVLDEDDITLYLVDVATEVQTLITTNFTLSPTGGSFPATGGTVTYPAVGTPLPSTKKIVILRETDLLQPTVLPTNTSLKPKVIEMSLDRATMGIQQVAEEVERCVKVGVGSGTDPDNLLTQISNSVSQSAASASAAAASATDAANTLTNIQQEVDAAAYEAMSSVMAEINTAVNTTNTQATNAGTSAGNAAASETAAAASAASALTHKNDAQASATAASGSANAANLAAQNVGSLAFATVAAMNADLAHAVNTICLVTNDTTASNNGQYIKLGASGSGSWQKSAYVPSVPVNVQTQINANETEITSSRTDAQGVIHSTLSNRANAIENVLNSGQYVFKPQWNLGYINGSDGAIVAGNALNIYTNLMFFPAGTVISNSHTGYMYIYEYTSSGVFVSPRLANINKSSGTYTVPADKFIRFSLEYGSTVSDPAVGLSLVTVTVTKQFTILSNVKASTDALNASAYQYVDLNKDYNGTNLKNGAARASRVEQALSNGASTIRLYPKWNLGYINASTGAEVTNSLNARSSMLFLRAGSTIAGSGSYISWVYSYQSDGTFIGQLAHLYNGNQSYTLTTDAYVKISIETGGITDPYAADSIVTIIEKSPFPLISNLKNMYGAENYWAGKKIVWFGTSIPAGQALINGVAQSYPELIGNTLGATMYNEAVGSSGVRAGHYGYITGNDPLGYAGLYYESLLRSLSLSSTEKQAIFDNWATWKTIIPTAPDTISAENQVFYKNCSWDIKLAKYLSGGSVGQVDLYVFDHGHNDAGYGYNYDALTTVPSNTKDRTYFIGAMNFLIDKILSDNPKARIVFIGHYENDRKTGISLAQSYLAEYWDYPFCKTWEKMGWSQKSVTSSGTTKTITQWWMPDDLHPHSDTTGKAIQLYADVLTPFIRDAR